MHKQNKYSKAAIISLVLAVSWPLLFCFPFFDWGDFFGTEINMLGGLLLLAGLFCLTIILGVVWIYKKGNKRPMVAGVGVILILITLASSSVLLCLPSSSLEWDLGDYYWIHTPLWVLVPVIFSILFGILGLAIIFTKKRKGRIFAGFGIILSVFVIIVWSRDMRPIENDYTVKDLQSAAPENHESYHLIKELMQLKTEFVEIEQKAEIILDNNPMVSPGMYPGGMFGSGFQEIDVFVGLGLGLEESKTLTELHQNIDHCDSALLYQDINKNREEIVTLWEKCEKGRKIIAQLNEYQEIADLLEPVGIGEKREEINQLNLRMYGFMLKLHCLLLCTEGNCMQAAKDMVLTDSVIRKFKHHNRDWMTGLVLVGVIRNNLQIASLMVTRQNCGPEVREFLKSYYSNTNRMTFRNECIFMYLVNKKTINNLSEVPGIQKLPMYLKKNSTLRLVKNYTDSVLNSLGCQNITKDNLCRVFLFSNRKHLASLFFFDEGTDYFERLYVAYNPVGAKMATMLLPALGRTPYFLEGICLQEKTVCRLAEISDEHSSLDIFVSDHDNHIGIDKDDPERMLPVDPSWIEEHRDRLDIMH